MALVRRLLPAPVRTNRYRWLVAVAAVGVTAALVVLAIGPASRFASSGAVPTDASTVDGDARGGPGIAATHADPVVATSTSSAGRTGSAAVTTDPAASGGAYVAGVGYWDASARAGSLVFTVDLPSDGDWRLTIYFLDTGPKGPRHATVAVSGQDPQNVMFAGWPTCCGTRTLDLSLTGGPHTVTIGNPTAAGPSIDRITFTLLP